MKGLTIALMASAGLAASAGAEIIELIDQSTGESAGWQVEIFNDGQVDIVTDFVDLDNGVVVIEKFAEFIDVDDNTGEPEPITLQFTQIAGDDATASTIIITNEFIVNNTGLTWTDFENILVDGGNATWNPGEMSNLSIDPFNQDEFAQGNTIYRVFDGTVGDGETWTPGLESGGFVIDVNLDGDQPVVFSLKEAPSIPAPGALALLGLGGLAATRRRR